MYIVAHQDDSLLFQSPDLLRDIRSGRCVRTVFLTAGDAGKEESYWITREEGAEAGYAQMAGVADEWETSLIGAGEGHPIRLETLRADPRVSLVFMRLPDGHYPAGIGTALYHFESLLKLWNGKHGEMPAESSIEAVDESTTYDYDELVDALAAMMDSFKPQWIATQNYSGTFASEDHPDHVATARFVDEAQQLYALPHQLIGYEGYETSSLAANVSGELLEGKEEAFLAYGKHDEDACSEGSGCAAEYELWLERQYTLAPVETMGVVADAGYAQTADSGDAVGLDGSRSSVEAGHALTYEWTQTAGPAVDLDGVATPTPSFVAPPAEASLSFLLTVSDGTDTNTDLVDVQVEGPAPTPTAIAGAAQSVASGATVTLDGSQSVDPYRLPLTYEWMQIAGPAVSLAGASSAKPTFSAPSGPASLVFSLVVTNAATSSAPSAVTVAVGPPPSGAGDPPFGSSSPAPPGDGGKGLRLSRHRVELLVGGRKPARRVVSVLGPERQRVWCTGRLPRGARCSAVGARGIVVEAAPATREFGVYRLTVHIASRSGTVKRELAVRLLAASRSS